jgi:hypothetical protein
MYGDPEFFILKPTTWLDVDKWETKILGSFVKEYPSPTNGYVWESGHQPVEENVKPKSLFETHNTADTLDGEFNDFVLDANSTSKKGASATLKSVLNVSFNGETEQVSHLEGKFLRYKRLTQLQEYFDKAKKDPNVAARVPNWIKSGLKIDVCVVTGIMICEDVEVVWEESKVVEMEAKGEVPIAAIVKAAVGVPTVDPTNDAGNAALEATSKKSVGKAFRAKSGQRKIFALQLRTVTKGKMLNLIKRNELRLGNEGPSAEQGRKFGVEEETMGDSLDDNELFMDLSDLGAEEKEDD